MIAPILSNIPALTNLLDLNTKRLRRAARIVIQFAEFHGLTYYRPVAGLYIWIRLSVECSNFDEEELLVQKCSRLGVFVGSGADYSEPQPGWFRLTFAIPEEKLFGGLQRIEEAMGYKERFENRLEVESLATMLAKWWKGICL
jgi:DNA-binding transcriptional MocR family regulator